MNNYPPIHKLPMNPTQENMFRLVPEITYSTMTEKELKLDLIYPWSCDVESITEKPKLPLVVFVQGSAWTTPKRNKQIPRLSELAHLGYVVATCDHRSTAEGALPPSYLVDIKCAIRFLRANADKYGIDPTRVMIFGTSSGGNIAQLVGLTGDDPRYETTEWEGQSDAVKAVISCFGPSNLRTTFRGLDQFPEAQEKYKAVFGEDVSKWPEIFDSLSPVTKVDTEKEYPPFLLLHGSGDPVVSFEECVEMYHVLYDAGVDVTAWEIEGAEHEGNFWSVELWKVIIEFIQKNL